MTLYRLRDRYRAEPDYMFEAADDTEALTLCRRFAKRSDYALRRGERCVALIPHNRPAQMVTGYL